MEYITSDLHFGHKNICGENGFCTTRKHFKDVDEMNEAIIENWNKKVNKNDKVYVLGDLCMNMKPNDLFETMNQLKGEIWLVKGNHDNNRIFKALVNGNPEKFKLIPMGDIVKRNGIQYYLTHYPQGLGEKRRKIRNLCGHIHEEIARDPNVMNVGIDSPEIDTKNFGEPVELQHAMDLLDEKFKKSIE
jgi:calcineurin-like phosphoesterase family protein